MQCPHCHSEDTRVRLNQVTSLGYPLHFCQSCQWSFNERTGTPFNHLEVPVDETYIKVQGQWCYLYRGIDESGNLLDVRLSERRYIAAAKAFFNRLQN